ncbi:hypothetical protein VKT23_011583 [Stygiomarasmius scandens]|uniref:Uncharacterized protein n=1 Tax=Marasmiellus scandens TaxID=2682957 RepID=A0ABR1J9I8_9AGAR
MSHHTRSSRSSKSSKSSRKSSSRNAGSSYRVDAGFPGHTDSLVLHHARLDPPQAIRPQRAGPPSTSMSQARTGNFIYPPLLDESSMRRRYEYEVQRPNNNASSVIAYPGAQPQQSYPAQTGGIAVNVTNYYYVCLCQTGYTITYCQCRRR